MLWVVAGLDDMEDKHAKHLVNVGARLQRKYIRELIRREVVDSELQAKLLTAIDKQVKHINARFGGLGK